MVVKNGSILPEKSRRLSRKYASDSDSDLSPPRKQPQSICNPSLLKDLFNSISPSQGTNGDNSGLVYLSNTFFSFQESEKLAYTLDGKRAGLQTRSSLLQEAHQIRREEDEAFNKLDKSLTGQNAKTAFRAENLRLVKAKEEADKEKAEQLAQLKVKYYKWGKGLKQIEQQSAKLAEDMKEMSKPLSRSAGDEELEEMLRAHKRAGDPMAFYLDKKRAKVHGDASKKSTRPIYQGPASAPNRFGILPGYRWDGIDRSNGYEKLFLGRRSDDKSRQQEAYRLSI